MHASACNAWADNVLPPLLLLGCAAACVCRWQIEKDQDWDGRETAVVPAPAPPTVIEAGGMILHLSSKSATGYRGVYIDRKRSPLKPYYTEVAHGSKHTRIGTFATAVEAAVAYARYVALKAEGAPDSECRGKDDKAFAAAKARTAEKERERQLLYGSRALTGGGGHVGTEEVTAVAVMVQSVDEHGLPMVQAVPVADAEWPVAAAAAAGGAGASSSSAVAARAELSEIEATAVPVMAPLSDDDMETEGSCRAIESARAAVAAEAARAGGAADGASSLVLRPAAPPAAGGGAGGFSSLHSPPTAAEQALAASLAANKKKTRIRRSEVRLHCYRDAAATVASLLWRRCRGMLGRGTHTRIRVATSMHTMHAC